LRDVRRSREMNPAQIGTGLVAVAAAVGALALLWKYGLRAWRGWRSARMKVAAVTDAILGREAVFDSITGKEIAPPLPGMGVRMAHQEQQMEAITVAVTSLASQREALENHEGRIKALEEAAVERVVTRAESAAAWRAVEAVANASDETEE
jgi:hypothetical protein